MRLLMVGTGPFAVPTLRVLHDSYHQVVALVTAPERTNRGKPIPGSNPMRDVALELGLPIYTPEDINSPETIEQLQEFQADLMVVCDYGYILSPETLATAGLGGVNLHGSLLPKYRGAAPINWAIYNGDQETGVTVIHMTPRVDAGPCIAQVSVPIGPEDTAVDVEHRLQEIGAWLIHRAIGSIESGRIQALSQDSSLASRAPKLKKTDGLIQWNRTSLQIKDHVRAMIPWPRTYTNWKKPNGEELRILVGPVEVADDWAKKKHFDPDSTPPGTVLVAERDRLLVATGSGAVRLTVVQPAGKREMDIEQFLRGYRVAVGDRFT